jgi:hypothetical protein
VPFPRLADVALGVSVVAVGGAIIWALVGGRSDGGAKASASAAWVDVRPTPGGGGLGVVGARF